MTFTTTVAQQYIQKINKLFKKATISKKAISQLRRNLVKIKASSAKEKQQVALVKKSLLEHLKLNPSPGYFESILRLLSIHETQDKEQLIAMLHCALELNDVAALKLLLGTYRLDINAKQDSEGNTLLHLAVKAGDRNRVKYLIEIAGTDVNSKNDKSETALHIAAAAGHSDILEFLLLKEATVDAVDNDNETPFHIAAKKNQLNALMVLKEHGANVDALGKDNDTALHSAVSCDYVDVYKFLVRTCKVLVNVINKHMASALHVAALDSNEAAVVFLLENGASVDYVDDLGNTILHDTARQPTASKIICALLINRVPKLQQRSYVNAKNKEGHTAFISAIQYGNLEVAGYLFDHFEIDLNDRNNDGDTVLHVAIEYGDAEKVQFLLEKGADVTAKDSDDITPLHLAAELGHRDICELLLKHKPKVEGKKADIYARNSKNYIPLHVAAEYGKQNVVEYFIESNVDINFQGGENETALHSAVREGHIEIVRLLLVNGADITAQDRFGNTALHYAAKLGDMEIWELLVNHIPKSKDKAADIYALNKINSTPWHWAADFGNKNIMEYLIKHMKDINICDGFENRTALHWAVWRDRVEMVSLLLANGADVTAQDKFGNTPLHYAAAKGFLNISKILVEHQPKSGKISDLNARNKNNFTPFHEAVIKGRTEVISYFLGCRVDIEILGGENNQTPLQIAVINRIETSVSCLLAHKANLHAKTHEGTMLHSAVCGGHVNICRLLVDHKPERVNLVAVNIHNDLAMHNLEYVNRAEDRLALARYFIEECYFDINHPGHKRFTVLHNAVKEENEDLNLIAYYISRGANVAAKEINGNTPLHLAVECCGADAVELLLQAGAKTNAPNIRDYDEEYNALYEAENDTPITMAERYFDEYPSERNTTILKLLQNFSVNLAITVQICSIVRKTGFTDLYGAHGHVIPPLQNIISQFAALDSSLYADLDPAVISSENPPPQILELRIMGIDPEKIVIEVAEEALLFFANQFSQMSQAFLEDLAKEVLARIPEPSRCKIYWEKLKKQFEEDPSGLDSISRPSKLDKNLLTKKFETKEREEKKQLPVSRQNESEQPIILPKAIELVPQSPRLDFKREVTEEKQIYCPEKLVNRSMDPDSNTILQSVSAASVMHSNISSSLVLVPKQELTVRTLTDWYWQVQAPSIFQENLLLTRKMGAKQKRESKEEVDFEYSLAVVKQSKHNCSLVGRTLQNTRIKFFSNQIKRKFEGDEEMREQVKKAKNEQAFSPFNKGGSRGIL